MQKQDFDKSKAVLISLGLSQRIIIIGKQRSEEEVNVPLNESITE